MLKDPLSSSLPDTTTKFNTKTSKALCPHRSCPLHQPPTREGLCAHSKLSLPPTTVPRTSPRLPSPLCPLELALTPPVQHNSPAFSPLEDPGLNGHFHSLQFLSAPSKELSFLATIRCYLFQNKPLPELRLPFPYSTCHLSYKASHMVIRGCVQGGTWGGLATELRPFPLCCSWEQGPCAQDTCQSINYS